jgi:hypothetical protein
MTLSREQARSIEGAVWLFGLAVLFYTGRWWPGIMFVIGTAAIVEGLIEGHGWYAIPGGSWAFFFGAWAVMGFQIWVLFVMLGVSMLVGAIVPPPMLAKKPRSPYETDLE